MDREVSKSIDKAKKWLLKQRKGSSWRLLVENESPTATALSLYVLKGDKRTKAIDYFLKNEVWKKSLYAGFIFVNALRDTGEYKLADEVLFECKNEIRNRGKNLSTKKIEKEAKKLLEHARADFPFGLNEKDLSIIPFYTWLLKLTPEKMWYSRTSFFYNVFPGIALITSSNKDKKLNQKIIYIIKKSLNENYSHASFSISTIMCIYVLRQLGENELANKSLKWIEGIINENGSIRYFSSQDIWETCLAGLALLNLEEDITDVIDWLETKKVGPGYPFISGSYVPDFDDTPMVLMMKKLTNRLDENAYETLDFLIESQRYDRGWPTYAYYTQKHDIFLKLFSIIINGFGLLTSSRRRGYGPLYPIKTRRLFMSFIDMTARTLQALSYFKEDKRVKKAISRGCNYLLKHYTDGIFKDLKNLKRIGPPLRWVDSDFYENALSIVALHKNGYKTKEIDDAVDWMVNQKIDAPENAAYALWAIIEGNYPREYADKMVDIIISKQSLDGSWKPRVGVSTSERNNEGGIFHIMDLIHSHAMPLFALALYKKKYINEIH